jgi:hypothetical protein
MEEKKSGRLVGTSSDRRARDGVQGLTITRLGQARQGMGMGMSMYGLVCAKRVRSAVGNSRRQGQEPEPRCLCTATMQRRAVGSGRRCATTPRQGTKVPRKCFVVPAAPVWRRSLPRPGIALGFLQAMSGTASEPSKHYPSEHRSYEAGRSDETATGCDSTLDWGVCACVVCVNGSM